jgi:hypothetical protein
LSVPRTRHWSSQPCLHAPRTRRWSSCLRPPRQAPLSRRGDKNDCTAVRIKSDWTCDRLDRHENTHTLLQKGTWCAPPSRFRTIGCKTYPDPDEHVRGESISAIQSIVCSCLDKVLTPAICTCVPILVLLAVFLASVNPAPCTRSPVPGAVGADVECSVQYTQEHYMRCTGCSTETCISRIQL